MTESAARRRLGDIFVERGLVTDEQLQEALAVQRDQGGKLGEILVELGFVTRVSLAGVIAEHWDDLQLTQRGRKNAETAARRAPDDAVARLTAELAERDRRIASLEATIATLVARLPAAGPSAA